MQAVLKAAAHIDFLFPLRAFTVKGCSMFTSVKAFEGQQYSTLKRQCLQSGLLFEDPRFPATDDSLFYQGNRIGRVVWKRPRVSPLVQ
ncbi:Calpain-5 [Collichthys lucidus]|uniref:Calpain-5 n=1 Tax=Collichthys lucidus TaxID=240159 RepID=A0A4U5V5X8_COLLU|nr:Calpain-5 [Collichthys lucidus]TKS83211.1 Calpain-5 [Collichthys lucidus]